METYTSFAQVYDIFMDDIPYGDWADYLVDRLREEGIREGLVCELGCGTGKMTRLLAKRGYDLIGIDASWEMLSIARETESEGILYLEQDMREFELYGTVKAVISVCDTMNYLLEEAELLQVFHLVNNYLDPGGIFLFDMNTVYHFREQMGTQVFTEHREEGSLIWENYFEEQTSINQYDLTLFIREASGLYRKYEETHFERGYETEKIAGLLEQAGMEYLGAVDADTHGAVRADSERMILMARERGK